MKRIFFSVRTTIAAICTVSVALRCYRCFKVSEAGAPRQATTDLRPHSSASFVSVASSTQTAYVLLGLQVRPVGDEYLTTGLRP